MENENLTNDENIVVDDTKKYLDTINDLKKNSVPRADYDKVRDENKALLEAIVNGKGVDAASTEADTSPSIDELRKKAYGPGYENLTDLEYVTAVCDLRDALLESEGVDYFIPSGNKYTPDVNDVYKAENLYKGLRHCIEVADGDNEIFIQEITRITNDTLPIKNYRRK